VNQSAHLGTILTIRCATVRITRYDASNTRRDAPLSSSTGVSQLSIDFVDFRCAPIDFVELAFVHCQFSIVNCPLSIVNCLHRFPHISCRQQTRPIVTHKDRRCVFFDCFVLCDWQIRLLPTSENRLR
jgi:hypothetical protein